MTNSNRDVFDTAKDAKAAGWFSRRHRTRDVHDESVAAYREKSGRTARRERAAARLAEGNRWRDMTPEERLLIGIFGDDRKSA